MGAKDWMAFYAERDVPSVLGERPTLDREATARLVERLFPSHAVTDLADVSLLEGDPTDGEEALGTLFGFVYEGPASVDTIDPEHITLGAFALKPRKRGLFGRRR
jgi:hypothetical protein